VIILGPPTASNHALGIKIAYLKKKRTSPLSDAQTRVGGKHDPIGANEIRLVDQVDRTGDIGIDDPLCLSKILIQERMAETATGIRQKGIDLTSSTAA
jgi:hypothetical protein